MMARSESDDDISNVEAWAEVVGGLLLLMPPEKRSAVLMSATARENSVAERRGSSGAVPFAFSDLENWSKTPAARNSGAIQRLKSLVVQVFVREITNENSQEDAAGLLFCEHQHGRGSRQLHDYIKDIIPK